MKNKGLDQKNWSDEIMLKYIFRCGQKKQRKKIKGNDIMRNIGVTSLDDVHDADIGFLDDNEVFNGIRFTKPVLVKEFDYEEHVVRFILRTGEIVERNMSDFRKTWWFKTRR